MILNAIIKEIQMKNMKTDLEQQFYAACDTNEQGLIIELLKSKKLNFNMLIPVKKYAIEKNMNVVNLLLKQSLSTQKISINHNNRLLAAALLGFAESKDKESFSRLYYNPDYSQFFQNTTAYEILKTLIQNKHFEFAHLLLKNMQPKAKKLSLYTPFYLNHVHEKSSVISEVIALLSIQEDKSFEFICWQYYLKNSVLASQEMEKRIIDLGKNNVSRIEDLNEHFQLSIKNPQLWVNVLLGLLNEKVFSISEIVTNTVPSRPAIEYILSQMDKKIDPQYYAQKTVMDNLEKQDNPIFEDFLNVVATKTDILDTHIEFAQAMLEKCLQKKHLDVFNLLIMEKKVPVPESLMDKIIKNEEYKAFEAVLNYNKMNQHLEQKDKKTLRKI